MAVPRIVPIIVVRGFLLLGALVPLGILACDDNPTGLELTPPILAVTPSQQWAGGEVRISITGDMFENSDVVVADTDTLEVFDRQYFLLALRLPTRANGPTTLTVLRDGETLGSVTTEAFGFEEYRVYPVRLEHYITEFPVEWGVSVVSPAYYGTNGDTSKGFVWIHPSSGIYLWFPGSPDLDALFRIGVDPVSGDLYFEWDYPSSVHAGRIVGGELVDLGWVSRPCNRWGCEPLAGDVWVVLDYGLTCRVVTGPEGEYCEFIERHLGDDPQGLTRLWSADVAIIEDYPHPPVFRMSSGILAYEFGQDHPTGPLGEFQATTDEERGLFYVSTGGLTSNDEPGFRILSLKGEDGTRVRSFVIAAEDNAPELGYDPIRDVILIHRTDTWTIELRDPIIFTLLGEISLSDHPDGWMEARILVDPDTDRVFVIYSAGWKDGGPTPGTPVISIRLPPI